MVCFVFFAALDTRWPPSKNFCGDLYPRILFPHAFVPQNPVPSCLCLLPTPPPGDPGSDVFTYSDPWPHQTIQGDAWATARKSQAPWTSLPLHPEKHVSPPWHKSGEACSPWRPPAFHRQHRFPARGKGGDLCIPGRPGNLPAHGPGHISRNGNMFSHVDVCFPGRGSRSSQHFPPRPPAPQAQHTIPPDKAGRNRLQTGRLPRGSTHLKGDAEVGECGGMAHVTHEAMHV